MRNILVPAGILIAALAGMPAEAKTCPAGQMFRVKLNICAARSENLKFLHRASKPHAVVARAANKSAPVAPVIEPTAVSSNVLKYRAETPAVGPVTQQETPVEGTSPTSSPYGALKLEAF